MQDVAARAGVSRSLVSTVFRDVPGASPATRARVLAAAAELGYRPDERARKLRSRESHLIGVTLTAVHPFHVAVTEALHEDALLGGYELSLSWTTKSRSLANAVEALLAQRCAALILIGPDGSDDELDRLTQLDPTVPAIVVDRYIDLPGIDALRVDDTAGLRLAVDHLHSLGHTLIHYLDGGCFVSAAPRRSAYVTAMTEAGLAEFITVIPSGGTRVDGAVSAEQLLTAGVLPTAIIGYNDQAAFGLLDVFSRRGIRVPEDVSVVGFDDVPEAALAHISLTTVEQRADRLAIAVSEAALARIGGEEPSGLTLLTPQVLVVRETTAPPRRPS
jgi:DNA-binding LacI/PurR family transcriptional regulator